MNRLETILTCQDHEYFKEREDHQFLIKIIQLRICKLTLRKGTYWFEYPGMHIKATTTPAASLRDLRGTKVMYWEYERTGDYTFREKNYPLIQGTLGGWGITDTPWIYVFWGRIPMRDEEGKPLGHPYSLPDNFHLKVLKP